VTEPAQKDPLAIGLGALTAGVGLGAACITVVLLLVRLLQRTAQATGDPATDVTGDLLIAGLIAGIAIAALFGWRRSDGIENLWQRGVVGVLSVFGALMVAFFLTIPARQLFGTVGLVLLAVAMALIGVAGSRWAIRGSGERGAGTAI